MIEVKTRRLLSPQHAAQQLGVSIRRIGQLVESGELEAITDSGGRRTFPVEAVERLGRARQQKATGAK